MRIIDNNDGPNHRINKPTKCPTCAGELECGANEMAVESDGNALDIAFECGAIVRWRSVLNSGPDGVGGGYCESLLEVQACPSSSSLIALLTEACGMYQELRLGQLLVAAATKGAPGVPFFYVVDDAMAAGLREMIAGGPERVDVAMQKAVQIQSYLTRKVGASLDGETVDQIAQIIRGANPVEVRDE